MLEESSAKVAMLHESEKHAPGSDETESTSVAHYPISIWEIGPPVVWGTFRLKSCLAISHDWGPMLLD
jgi:hypothetical protein